MPKTYREEHYKTGKNKNKNETKGREKEEKS